MNFLVTGCAGFIGSHMVDLLLENDHAVIGIDSFTYAASINNIEHVYSNNKFRIFNNDIQNTHFIQDLCDINNVDWILNFAAETHVDNSINDCQNFIMSNIVGVKSLLNICKNIGVKMLHVSTDEVYGSRNEGSFIEEDKLEPRNPYSATKAAAEHMISAYKNTYGTNVVMVRPSNNFGPRQHVEKFLPTIVRSLDEGKKIPVYGDGLNIRDWLFVKDNVSAIFHIIQNCEANDVYNITSCNEMTNIDMVKSVCKIMNLNWKDCITYVQDRKGHDFRYSIDNTRLLKTGFCFQSDFMKNLKETIESLRETK
jgi:dTDP-glucose 4,6-dehydratase